MIGSSGGTVISPFLPISHLVIQDENPEWFLYQAESNLDLRYEYTKEGKMMSGVSVGIRIKAPVEQIWEAISDFNGLPRFIDAISKSTMEGAGVGAVRTLTLKGGGPPIIERLELVNDKARSLTYSIVTSPLPIMGYVSTMEVRDHGAGECEVLWHSTFQPVDVTETEAKKVVEGFYLMGLEGLKKLFER